MELRAKLRTWERYCVKIDTVDDETQEPGQHDRHERIRIVTDAHEGMVIVLETGWEGDDPYSVLEWLTALRDQADAAIARVRARHVDD